MNKTIKLLLTFTFIFVIISTINIKYTYAANSTIDMNLVDNLIPNSSSSSNSTTNNSDSGILAPDYKDSNSLGENKSSSSGNVSSISSLPESELGLTNILNILLIAVGVVLILLGVAIILKLKK